MEVLINQVGFDLGAPKFVMVQANDDLGGAPGRLQVVDERGVLRHEAELEYAGTIRHWGRHYWRGDFSAFDDEGAYELRLRVGAGETSHHHAVIGPRLIARETLAAAAGFYYYQRCGTEVPGWHGPCHLDDARLPDGTRIDAVGGWHDAGDYNKYNGYTPLAVFALACAARHPLLQPWPLAEVPPPDEEAAWGAQWMAKMQDPGTGFLRGDVFAGYRWWGPPEGETDNQPGNDDDRPVRGQPSARHRAGSALLAFAELGALRHEAQWLECARRLAAAVADAELTVAELAAAALGYVGLPQADPHRERTEAAVRQVLDCQRADGGFHDPQIVDAGFVPAALAAFALRAPATALAERIESALLRYLDFSDARSRNPFRLLQWDEANFFYPYPEPKAWYVGQNSAYLSQAWALLLAAKFLAWRNAVAPSMGAARARALAQSQLDWVLGCNPFGVCMLEGAGQFNPPRYHHRYDAIPGHPRGAVPGAVCNGIVRESVDRDAPRFDLHGNDYHSNEPWLPHNAYYLLAVGET